MTEIGISHDSKTEQSGACRLSDQSSSGQSGGEPTLNPLVKITQVNGKPLPLGNFTEWALGQLVYDLTGIHPVCAAKSNDYEVLIELDPIKNVIGVAQEIQKLTCWEGLNVEATYLLSSKRQLMDISREWDEGCKRQESIESEHNP